ncbi:MULTISPECIES: autotransporter [unclassified Bacillus (in: firmicutes)]|uniref:autotransporter n=1 Tax=unclassified Bacillus (in: firmicutes) TaxID=185979 RepID=UPI0038377CB3
MRKNICVVMFFILLGIFHPFSDIYAETNELFLSQDNKISVIFKNENNIEEIIHNIKNSELVNWNSNDLNQLLDTVDHIGLNIMERATLKREIIRESGFFNFDFKGTKSDVLAFENLRIEIMELNESITLYRRGKAGEVESKYGLGYWWGDKKRNIEETRNELAVLEAWGNPLSTEYIIQVPKGVRVLRGITASQTQYFNGTNTIQEYREGGAMQYWFNKVSNSWLK